MAYKVLAVTNLNFLKTLDVENTRKNRDYAKAKLDDISFKYFPEKVKNFLRSCKCMACGIEGSEVRIEKQPIPHAIYGKPHLNVYAVTKDEFGNPYEMMMTVDHDILKSKGGEDKATNFNTLCRRCNARRGSKFDSIEEFLVSIEGRDLLREYMLMDRNNRAESERRKVVRSMTKEQHEAAKNIFLQYLHVSHVGEYNRYLKKLKKQSNDA